MDGLRQYVLELVIAALICGIITGLVKEGSLREILKFICGVFLAVTVLRPIVGTDFLTLLDFSHLHTDDAAQAVSAGENLSRDAAAAIIKAECEAYILDKAAQLEVQISAEVTLSEDDPPVPVSVLITGNVTPYNKLRLEEIIQEDLGITKENQLWTG